MGVKFVTPKAGDAVAVVARSVEAKEEDEGIEAAPEADGPRAPTLRAPPPNRRMRTRMQQSTRRSHPTCRRGE